MEYYIIINKRERNEKYEAKIDPYRREPEQPMYLSEKVFEMTLEQKEFDAIRKGVLEII